MRYYQNIMKDFEYMKIKNLDKRKNVDANAILVTTLNEICEDLGIR